MDVDSDNWTKVVQPDGSVRYESEEVIETIALSDLLPVYTEQDKFMIQKLLSESTIQGISSNKLGDHFALNYDTPLSNEEKKVEGEDVLGVAQRVYGRFTTTDMLPEQKNATNYLKAIQRDQLAKEELLTIKFPDFKPDLSLISPVLRLDLNERPKVKRDKPEEVNHLDKRIKIESEVSFITK